MAKIAADLERAVARRRHDGTAGCTTPRIVARGEGWTAADVLCTCGPHDRPFEEKHASQTIAVVLAGSFQFRSAAGRPLMTPGSLMLGNEGHSYECGHQHGVGDRCMSFWYEAEYFERLWADAGARGRHARFNVSRVPPLRELSALTARAAAAAVGASGVPWEALAVSLAVRTVRVAAGITSEQDGPPPNAEARVSRTIRTIDRHPDESLTLDMLARQAGLSPYHFLRTFERMTGLTPHRYVRRARLREAATRLMSESGKVLDIALDSGFEDVSNFNRAFRTEFGVSPRVYRRGTD